MRILKIVLIVLAVIILIPLLAALFIAKDYGVTREITINKPKSEVFAYLKYLKNQDNFSVWSQRDPNMKKSYRGTDGEVGFVSAWSSPMEEVGVGEQEIKAIVEGEKIDYELRFFEPFESTEKAYMRTEALSENSTKVIWGFNGHMKYPTNIFLVLMDFEGMIGTDLQGGLDKLKTVLEKS